MTDILAKDLVAAFGVKKAGWLEEKYKYAFSRSYWDECAAEKMATQDIGYLEKLSAENFIELDFYFAPAKDEKIGEDKKKAESKKDLHLRLYQWQESVALSDIMPMLTDLDIRAWSERTYQVKLADMTLYISDFYISSAQVDESQLDLVRELFHDAFIEILSKRFESDGFNKLILDAKLSWREISILRAYGKYLRQVGFRFSQIYIEQALANNPEIAKDLVAMFLLQHDPKQKAAARAKAQDFETKIIQALDKVNSLDEDRIIRRMLDLIKATLRTNFFQLSAQGKPKPYLCFKLSSRAIPELPLPMPLYEIFVYSARFEGIHLRAAKVARGGIRWSERPEDFRTEILGLMKAQWVKNAVIVPSGAKGGFVLKTLPAAPTRDLVQKEVVACYELFIRALLDLTDNLVENKLVRPKSVVCRDEEDPYLVVAADKGTATFSDLANSISAEYNFWLGDAFASGGATGYDHKKMGITARGAWESVKRHFRFLNIDVKKTVVTVVGIGDMSGDVFGNGLIYSKNLQLVGAFDHRHVFLDPSPDPVASYKERQRLFKLPTSSWEDYDPKLISKGGGVYKRSAKSITLSPEMKRVMAIEDNNLTPNDVIRALLKAPVDLLWNGGIGTYVKASYETAADVGDKTNDNNRVNGDELRCKVVGEGGNLGFTQNGRVEYALAGGLINTDFIDNSAGVDCSDHEVNLKILLNAVVTAGKLTEAKRNALLAEVTQEVSDLVLADNYYQAWIMGYVVAYSHKNTSLYQSYIKELEAQGHLNRQVEHLPEDKTILERKAANIGLTSPELAVLLSYTKIFIKNQILASDLPENAYIGQIWETAFPQTVVKRYESMGKKHRLYRELVATQLSNRVVNEMGILFVYRLQMETGATVAEIILAHTVASAIFASQELQKVIEGLDFKISGELQYELLRHIRHLLNLAARWFLRNGRLEGDLLTIIEYYSEAIHTLQTHVIKLMSGATRDYLDKITAQFLEAGLSADLASTISSYRVIYTALNIIEVTKTHHFDLVKTAKMYFSVGERFNLVWFRDQIANDSREGTWNALARLTLRDELDHLQRSLTIAMLNAGKKEESINDLIEDWVKENGDALKRWENLLASVHQSTAVDYSIFFIVLRELDNLVAASE